MLQHTAECALAVTFLQLREGTSEGKKSPEVCYTLVLAWYSSVLLMYTASMYCCTWILQGDWDILHDLAIALIWCSLVQAHEQLQRSLLPVLHQLESLEEVSEQAKTRDWSSLQMLARRTKNQLALD